MRRTVRMIGRLLGRRTPRRRRTDLAPGLKPYIGPRTPRRRKADKTPHTTPSSVARELAINVGEAALDPRTLETLGGIARSWRGREAGLKDELFCLDAYSVEFAIERVAMPEGLRKELISEYRGKLADLGTDLEVYLLRARAYEERLAANQKLAKRGVVRGISVTVGEEFNASLGTDNAFLADAVGRRFIDRSEGIREYIETSVREMMTRR
jgi:hypothetical protein